MLGAAVMEFSQELKRLRKRERLTQLQLSAEIGVSERTIRVWETGKPPPPSQARTLAAFFRLTGAEFAQFIALAARDDPDSLPTAVPAATKTLPRDIASFTGRARELEKLAAAMASAADTGGVPLICVIHGMPGVGKTKLAIHFAHQVADKYPDGQFFVNLYGHSAERRAVNAKDELSALLLEAGVPPPMIGDDIDERAAAWRHWTADRKVLMLLDDAMGAEQVIPLLPGSAGNLVLITSRQRLAALPDATDIPVEIMTPEDGAALFTRLADRAGLQAASREVAEAVGLCGWLPIVIAPIAGQHKQHRTWRVSDLGARLGRSGGPLTLLVSDRTSVADAFDLSYRHLSDPLKRLFRLLGLHPGPDIDAYSAAALADTDPDTAGSLLEELFGYHLIDEGTSDRYQFHELIRDFAGKQLAGDPPAEREAAELRMLDYHLRMARAADRHLCRHTPTGIPPETGARPGHFPRLLTRRDAFAWMDDNYLHLHAAADYAYAHGYPEYASLIPAFMNEYLTRRGHWNQLSYLQQLALRAASDTDVPRRARALSDMGATQYLLGRLDAGIENLGKALALYDELGDKLGRAQVLSRHGAIIFATGDYEETARTWSAALKLFREVGDRRGEADTLGHIGVLEYETGRIADALASQSAARDMCADLDDPLGHANALCFLGEIQRDRGHYDEAIELIGLAVEIYRDIGDSWNVAGARYFLGAALRADRKFDEASAELDAALEAYRGAGDIFDEAGVLNQFGMLQTATGDHPAAAVSLEAALELYSTYGSENGKAEVLNSLGELALAKTSLADAERYHSAALAISVANKILREQARAHEGIGHFLLADGRPAQALPSFRTAYDLYEQLQSASAARLAALIEAIGG